MRTLASSLGGVDSDYTMFKMSLQYSIMVLLEIYYLVSGKDGAIVMSCTPRDKS